MKTLLFIPLLMVLFMSGNLQAKTPFHFGFVDVEVALQDNGDLLVKETEQYVFDEPYSDLRYRWISLAGIDSIADLSVTEDGKPFDIKTNLENSQQWVEWTKAVAPPETHTFVLSYRVVGGVAVSDEGDQIDWPLVFKNLDVPINKSKVTVRVPVSLSGHVLSYQGAKSNKLQANKLDEQTFEFIKDQPYSASKGLKVSVTFSHGILNIQKSKKAVSEWWESEPASEAGWITRLDIVESSVGNWAAGLRWFLLILFFGFITKYFVGKERLKIKQKAIKTTRNIG